MLTRVLSVSMALPPSGVSPIINSFRTKYRGILSSRAYNTLGELGTSGQQNLRQLDSLLSQSSYKDLDFGNYNKLLPEIVSLLKDLDVARGISLEPVLFDGIFLLVTIAEKADFLEDVQQGNLKAEDPTLGLSSFATLETLENGYSGLPILPPVVVEAVQVVPEQAIANTKGPIKRPSETVLSLAKDVDQVFSMYFYHRNGLVEQGGQTVKKTLQTMGVDGVLIIALLVDNFIFPISTSIVLLLNATFCFFSGYAISLLAQANASRKKIVELDLSLGESLADPKLAAEEIARTIAGNHPDNQHLVVKIIEQRDPAKAAAVQDKLVCLNQLQVEAAGAAVSSYNRGIAEFKLGRYEEAIQYYDEAIRLNPEDAQAYNNRGAAKFKLGRYDEAIQDFDEAIRLNPEEAIAYNNRAVAKSNLGRHEEAECDRAMAKKLGFRI